MNSIFSVEDLTDTNLWQQNNCPMNRSASEWALEKFLEEMTSSTSSNPQHDVAAVQKPNLTPQIDSQDVHAILKSKLHLACAAAAMSRVASVKPEDLAESRRVAVGSDHGSSLPQSEADGSSVTLPAIPAVQQKQDGQAKQTTSGSSREDSDDDDDIEGETETNADPADAKRARRMQSNRESARRSRRRKQQQLSELETQVGQLRDERTSLLSRYTDINKKCDDASVDNRILKANIETLRTKVKMAEEQVKRVTGINPMLIARSNMSGMGMQYGGGQMDASANMGLPMACSGDQFFRQHVPNINPAAPSLHRLTGSYPNNTTMVALDTNLHADNAPGAIAEMSSIKHASSAESIADLPSMRQVQNQIGSAVSPSRSFPVQDTGVSHVVGKDNKKKK